MPSDAFRQQMHIKVVKDYQRLYQASLADPEGFWAVMAEDLSWFRRWERVLVDDFANGKQGWFVGGRINASYNCLDRHLAAGKGDRVALIWEGEYEGERRVYTYKGLYEEVCRFANVLKRHGVKEGDRVLVYLPMIPELAIAMLSCARIGAIHSVVLSVFSADALRERIVDVGARVVVCCDGYYLRGKHIEGKAAADRAISQLPGVERVFVVRRSGAEVSMQAGRDFWWDAELGSGDLPLESPPVELDAEAPLFILYTSGSTGRPKGVLHTTAGYLLCVKKTLDWVFDYKDGEVIWCTADYGWITGHSYGLYGPLCAGATSLMVEGGLDYPRPDRPWEVIERNRVNIFYTTPTVIQACMRQGDEPVRRHDLTSLRILGTVGDPIRPDVWHWYQQVVGEGRCPIVDTWWQTETGAVMISPLPDATPLKPGSAGVPLFGVVPTILREDGTECEVDEGGYLVIKGPWPGMMRSSFGDPRGLKEIYFSQFPGCYFTGDWARKDADGCYWFMGRVDDVIKVHGYRVGGLEIEYALSTHEAVLEAAVVGFPHEDKGEGIYAFVVLKPQVDPSEGLKEDLKRHCREKIGPHAVPDRIQFVQVISRTIQGKTMRRILRKIAAGDIKDLGDTSTLADRSVIDALWQGRQG